VLGFDVDERDARPLLAALGAARAALPADDPAVLAGETAVLPIFADMCALSRNRRGPEDETQQVDAAGEEDRNPQEFLYAYLRSRDADAEGLPESFREKLRRAVATTACPTWSPSDRLSTALYRMFLAHRGATSQVPVVLELLQWRLTHPARCRVRPARGVPAMLDRLVTATQLRHPVVGELARGCATPASTRR
jgi:hypothetical protein